MNKNKYIPLLLLLAAGAGFSAEETAPVTVTVKSFEALRVYPEHSAPATVISLNHSQLSARISAGINRIEVQVGDKVDKGDTLLRLDCGDGRLAEQSAGARLQLAEKELRRAKSLRRSNSIAEQGFNQAQTELTQARVGMDQARLQVKRCTVTAPFTGIISARQASEGELAVPGTPLLRLLDTRRLEVSAQAPVDQAAGIASAKKLWFRDDFAQYPLELRVVTPVINTSARNQEVRLTFHGKNALPGSAGRLLWQSARPHLPPDLLVQRDGQTGVLIFKQDTVSFVALAGAQIGHPAPAELPADAQVIVDGRFGLVDGDAVTVISN